eukprot:CCRYP_018482-RA/>CCRYP_018482-RA protein AED:0.46 eAED:0.67 QI:0/0/0/1/0/0/2/0/123
MVQYYRDIWARRGEILAPLTNLVEKPWHWDDIHQQAFDTVKATIARDVTLAYPDYSQGFEIYTDSSKFQLGCDYSKQQALAFFSRKLSQAQQKYRRRTGTTGHSRNTKRVQRHALGTTDYGLH